MLSLLNSIVFFLLFAIWSKSSLLNFSIKVVLLGLGIANLVVYLR